MGIRGQGLKVQPFKRSRVKRSRVKEAGVAATPMALDGHGLVTQGRLRKKWPTLGFEL
jgi:hypothetical protein